MSSRPLDVLRTAVGTDGPELGVALAKLTPQRVAAIAEQTLEPSDARPLPTPSRAEVWPLVTLRASTLAVGGTYRDAAGPAGLNLAAALNPRFAGTGHFSDGVLKALLYCHGLVLEDPIAAAAEMFLATSEELRPVAQLAVVAATTSTLEISPVLDNDVVHTFFTSSARQSPVEGLGEAIFQEIKAAGSFSVREAWDVFETSYVEGLSPSLQQLWRRVRSGDRSPPLDLLKQGLREGDADIVDTFIDVLDGLNPEAVVRNAADTVASAVLAIEGLGGFHDLLCPSPLFARLLFLGYPDPASEMRLHELGRVEVPGISSLDAADAVAIRRTSDAFARWRQDLSAALGYAQALREREGPEADTSSAVRGLIADARQAVHREAHGSRLLNPENVFVFVAGLAGGAVAGAPGGATGAAFGATGGALPALVQAAVGLKRVPGYLDRHYLVFEPPD